MERTLRIGGVELRMRASALIPRLYRFKFGRDLIKDMSQLEKAYKKALSVQEGATDEERRDAELSILDLTIFENVAWAMAKNADPNVPDDPGEWLDSIDGIFSVYEVLPEILELWTDGLNTTSTPAKK
jgi:hypothetical protein